MKILFCKVSEMKYYKGACEQDMPNNGGKFVEENGFGHEEYNFLPISLDGEDQKRCVGFVEPKSKNGTRNTLHIENIKGCSECKNEPYIDDVLVVWCATRDVRDTTVVGWYKNATVFRTLQDWIMEFPNNQEEERYYNVIANADDCTLLPYGERNRRIWSVPSAKYTRSYGFGQAMVWYPTEEAADGYLDRLLKNIEEYEGENWINTFPNE